MTTYLVSATFRNGGTSSATVTEERLAEMQTSPWWTVHSVVEHVPNIRYRTCEGCERCTYDEHVPHYNCMYKGKAVGHSEAHCTANACY